jgi:phage terminase large subunit-like protein
MPHPIRPAIAHAKALKDARIVDPLKRLLAAPRVVPSEQDAGGVPQARTCRLSRDEQTGDRDKVKRADALAAQVNVGNVLMLRLNWKAALPAR